MNRSKRFDYSHRFWTLTYAGKGRPGTVGRFSSYAASGRFLCTRLLGKRGSFFQEPCAKKTQREALAYEENLPTVPGRPLHTDPRIPGQRSSASVSVSPRPLIHDPIITPGIVKLRECPGRARGLPWQLS